MNIWKTIGAILSVATLTTSAGNAQDPATITPFDLARRLHFRLLDRAPSRAELDLFTTDADWTALVERILSHEDFGTTRTRFWTELLGIETEKERQWLAAQIGENTPIDRRLHDWFAEIRPLSETEEAAFDYLERTGPHFFGDGFTCSRCHDHPFEATTQFDFLSMAGFFRKGGYAITPPRYLYRDSEPGAPIPATTRFGPKVKVPLTNTDKNRIREGVAPAKTRNARKKFADWMTDFPDNPRVFFHLAAHYSEWLEGEGDLSDPVERALREKPLKTPTELLKVSSLLRKHHFDEVEVIRAIANQSAMVQVGERRTVSKTQWLRSIEIALGVGIDREGELPGPHSPFLQQSVFIDKILAEGELDNVADLEDIWLRTLTRLPTPEEKEQFTSLIGKHDLPASEIYRAIFLSYEFRTIP